MKPKRCSRCGSRRIGRYLFGYPSSEIFDDPLYQDGLIRLGGCVVGGRQPEFFCDNCDREWDSEGKVLDEVE